MEVKTYELILDEYTRHTKLSVKESLGDADDYYTTPLAVFKLMTENFSLHKMADEYMYMLAFNTKMKLLGVFEISHGIGNASLIDARGVYVRALQIGASFIMLVHNHPSGNPQYSKEDLQVTEKIKEAGEIIGIPLKDHIIIGSKKYLSFHEEGII